jgi:hypothetical protein
VSATEATSVGATPAARTPPRRTGSVTSWLASHASAQGYRADGQDQDQAAGCGPDGGDLAERHRGPGAEDQDRERIEDRASGIDTTAQAGESDARDGRDYHQDQEEPVKNVSQSRQRRLLAGLPSCVLHCTTVPDHCAAPAPAGATRVSTFSPAWL